MWRAGMDRKLPNSFSRRAFIKSLGAASGSILFRPLLSFSVPAEKAPCTEVAGKRIRWIVPHATGGGYDVYSRIIAPYFGKALGTEIFVDNITGAGGIVGAKTISGAEPDGLTIGILNGSGLMVAALAEEKGVPSPEKDFTVLGRIARTRHIWATGKDSPFRTIEDILKASEKRSIVFGTRDVGSISFVSITVTSHLLGIHPEVVAGYSGSRKGVLAALRGDVDVVSYNFESVLDQIENGDIRPLLQISDEPISPHASLFRVPLLGGEKGLAARRAPMLGRNIENAVTDTSALARLIGAGRLIVAPPGMRSSLHRCLEKVLHKTLNSPDLLEAAARADRSLDIARGDTARRDLRVVTQAMGKFAPLIRNAIKEIRK